MRKSLLFFVIMASLLTLGSASVWAQQQDLTCHDGYSEYDLFPVDGTNDVCCQPLDRPRNLRKSSPCHGRDQAVDTDGDNVPDVCCLLSRTKG
jgi:hypothetical protein